MHDQMHHAKNGASEDQFLGGLFAFPARQHTVVLARLSLPKMSSGYFDPKKAVVPENLILAQTGASSGKLAGAYAANNDGSATNVRWFGPTIARFQRRSSRAG
jgi:hypothetical protein